MTDPRDPDADSIDPRAGVAPNASGQDRPDGAGDRQPGGISPDTADPGLPAPLPGSGTLDRLAEGARDYARSAVSDNTLRAYAADWAAWTRWCRRHGAEPLPPRPDLVGLYLTELATPPRGRHAKDAGPSIRRTTVRSMAGAGLASGSGTGGGRPGGGLSVTSIERRLSGLAWGCTQAGHRFERADRHIATVLAGIRRRHGRPPVQKDAVSADDLRAMLATLGHDLRGLRDRAILLTGFAGGLRRSEITGLDCGRDDTPAGDDAGTGWVEITPEGLLLTLRGKTGWRKVAIGRGSTPATCPVTALEAWMRFARIAPTNCGPLFRRTTRNGTRALPARLSHQHVSLLVKRTAAAANLRPDLPEAERRALFSGHSLRAGLASHAEADERYVQKHLGHASVEMTRRYQRHRDRFHVNLTKAAGL